MQQSKVWIHNAKSLKSKETHQTTKKKADTQTKTKQCKQTINKHTHTTTKQKQTQKTAKQQWKSCAHAVVVVFADFKGYHVLRCVFVFVLLPCCVCLCVCCLIAVGCFRLYTQKHENHPLPP